MTEAGDYIAVVSAIGGSISTISITSPNNLISITYEGTQASTLQGDYYTMMRYIEFTAQAGATVGGSSATGWGGVTIIKK